MSVPQNLIDQGFQEAQPAGLGGGVRWPPTALRDFIHHAASPLTQGQTLIVGKEQWAVVLKDGAAIGGLGEGRYTCPAGPALLWVSGKPWVMRIYLKDIWLQDHRRLSAEIWLHLAITDAARFVAKNVGDKTSLSRRGLEKSLEAAANDLISKVAQQRSGTDFETNREAALAGAAPILTEHFASAGIGFDRLEVSQSTVFTARNRGARPAPAAVPAPTPPPEPQPSAPEPVAIEPVVPQAQPAPPEPVEAPRAAAVAGSQRRIVRQRVTLERVEGSFSVSGSGGQDMKAMLIAQLDALNAQLASGAISQQHYDLQADTLMQALSMME